MILRRISFIILAAIVPVLLVIFIGGAMAEQTAPEMLTLSVTPVSSAPVPTGDPAVFKVVLDNMGGQNRNNMFLELNWDKETIRRAKVEIVEAETGKVAHPGHSPYGRQSALAGGHPKRWAAHAPGNAAAGRLLQRTNNREPGCRGWNTRWEQ